MIEPVIPADKRVIIRTQAGRVIVARYHDTGHYTFAIEDAANWRALEADACQAVEDLVGAITGDEHFPCPDALAARARWG
jgi:hypothetical protein